MSNEQGISQEDTMHDAHVGECSRGAEVAQTLDAAVCAYTSIPCHFLGTGIGLPARMIKRMRVINKVIRSNINHFTDVFNEACTDVLSILAPEAGSQPSEPPVETMVERFFFPGYAE